MIWLIIFINREDQEILMLTMSLDPMRQLASRVIRQCLRVRKGEKVLVEASHLDDLTLPEFLALECVDVGAYPVMVVRPETVLHSKLVGWRPEDMEQVPPHISSIYNNCDVRVSVYSFFWPSWWQDIDEKKRAALDKTNQRLTDIIVKRKVRNLNISVPTEKAARERGLNYPQLLDDFIRAVNIDYEDMRKLANRLRRKLETCTEIRIESDDGTNLTFSVEGRTFLIEDGVISDEDIKQGVHYAEIPTGELFVAPIEDSAEGKAVFPNVPNIGKLELLFRGGKVVEAKGERYEIFWKRVEQATGEKDRIAEFAIGLNPGVSISNEKALGSIHIAIGKNNHIGGRNESSLHWDMVMHKPTIKANRKLIMKRGRLIL